MRYKLLYVTNFCVSLGGYFETTFPIHHILLKTICEIAASFYAGSCLGLFIFNFTSG